MNTFDIEQLILLLTALATAFAAFSTRKAAQSSEKAVKISERMIYETKAAARGQLVSSLFDMYWSDEFTEKIRVVQNWKKKYGHRYLDQFKACRFSPEAVSSEDIAEYKLLDTSRRHIKKYFRKTHQLRAANYISDYDVNNVLCPKHRVELLLDDIECYEEVMNVNYVTEMYDYYRQQINR